MIVLGVYNAFARIPLRVRRFVARLSGYRFVHAIRCYAIEKVKRHGVRHGYATSINIPRSTSYLGRDPRLVR